MRAILTLAGAEFVTMRRNLFSIVMVLTLVLTVAGFYLVPDGDQRTIAAGRAGNDAIAAAAMTEDLPVRYLGERREPVGNRTNLIINLIVFEVLILPFVFIGVNLFQEKQDGTIRAYRVTPGGTGTYVAAKMLLWTVLTILYGVALLLLTVGLNLSLFAWASMIVLFTVAGLFISAFGLLVALFFSSISAWFLPGISILLVSQLPIVSYLFPAFSPRWLTWFPTYRLLYAVRDILTIGPSGLMGPGEAIGGALLYLVALAGVATIAVRAAAARVLMKEARI
ncbi:MAG: ABC transporter permease [bacterium]